ADLRAGAQRLARPAIRPVEIPELECPVLEGIGCEHPVLATYLVPHFARQPCQRDWSRIPILACFFLPLAALCRMKLCHATAAFLDPAGQACVICNMSSTDVDERRKGKRGVGKKALGAFRKPLVVGRPFRYLDVGKA